MSKRGALAPSWYALRMRRAIPLLLLAIVLPSHAAAEENSPTKETLRSMLSAYEGVPTREHVLAMGPDAASLLRSLHDDANEPAFVRLRSLSALRYFPTETNRRYLARVASRGTSLLFAREAILSLGRGFGDRALDDVRPFLDRSEKMLREAAIRSLGHMREPRARTALEGHRVREREPRLRALVDQMLRVNAGPGASRTP